MKKIINPPCNSWKQATSFIMSDEKKKKNKSRVVVWGESSRRVEGPGAAPDVGVSPYDQFPLIPHCAWGCHKWWRCEERKFFTWNKAFLIEMNLLFLIQIDFHTVSQVIKRDCRIQQLLSEVSSGLNSCEDCLKETPTSGWWSFWVRCSFVP